MSETVDISTFPNTRHVSMDGRDIYLVGTAHVSDESRREVEAVLQAVDPDSVCVELCESRMKSLEDQDRWKNLNIIQVIRAGKGFLLFVNMVLHSFQKKIGLELDSAPGEEMMAAVNIAKEKGKTLVLADRDVNVTLSRAWKLSGFRGKLRILEVLLDSMFTNEEVKKEDIEGLLKGENLMNEAMGIFAEKLPAVKKVLIDERDEFLAENIRSAAGKTVVAVIGKGHQAGIARRLAEGFTYDPSIASVPVKKGLSSLIPWILTALVLGVFAYGFYKGGMDKGLQMLLTWALVTGTTTALSALLVLAHPLTILSSWLVAPITTLNPFIGAGMFLALIEAVFHKPRVADFEHLSTDISTVKGFFKNRLTKILIVFVATSVGASIGTFVGIPWVSSLLGK